MKRTVAFAILFLLQGCTSNSVVTGTPAESSCEGSVAISDELSNHFKLTQDPSLLEQSLGEPSEGKLCQGAVYLATQNVTIYRAWNSSNPKSQFGQWWAFEVPAGKMAQYRKDYAICYQWSPLDKMSKCVLKEGTKVVVGNGQSAKCSAYLTYPVSQAQQLYIANAEQSVANCHVYNGVFSWQ